VTHGRAEIHQLLAANDLHPSRALGQNFVADGNTVRRIVRLADIASGQRVVEIGAGLGSLTLALAEAGASVTAVEVDRHVVPVLRSQVEPLGVRVVEADALTLGWDQLLGPPGPVEQSWALVANLPYNVAVPLVIRVLEEAPQVSSLVVMVQREVGERLAASAGAEAYGAVSVKVAYWATASVVGRVPASVFIPRPKVESVLVRLVRRPGRRPGGEGEEAVGPGAADYERLFTVVRAGFAHRRKMLRRSLDGLVEPEAFDAAGIRPTSRAEELSLPEWERLAWWPDGVTDGSEDPGRGDPVELTAPAKLTLTLRVTGVRADGYHLLESEMVSLDLADTLVVEEGDGLIVSAEDPTGATGESDRWSMAVPDGTDNLVARALAAAGREARVRLVKRIPPGAGLGGGSSDAAAILRWAGATDRQMAARLGADVPFCLAGGRAMVRGIGEDITPLPYQEREFLLLLLPFGVDTAAVYRAWDTLAQGTEAPSGDGDSSNDLERAALEVEPRLGEWKALFEEVTGRRAHLAGSGSTWFVEGSAEELDLVDQHSLHLEGEEARLVPVRTVPTRG
jgi:16S rRNA (adenine1518-N6/adenine1519-N6)-dimethyltransferase